MTLLICIWLKCPQFLTLNLHNGLLINLISLLHLRDKLHLPKILYFYLNSLYFSQLTVHQLFNYRVAPLLLLATKSYKLIHLYRRIHTFLYWIVDLEIRCLITLKVFENICCHTIQQLHLLIHICDSYHKRSFKLYLSLLSS